MTSTTHTQFHPAAGALPAARPFALLRDDLLSIETCFILFIFAGRIKGLPEFRSIPVDLTLLFFTLTFALVVWGVASRRLRPLPIDAPTILMMAFCGFAVVSVYWSSLDPRNIDKAWRFILVGASSYFFVVVLAQDRQRRARLVRLVVGFSAALMIYYAYYRWVVGIDQMELYNTGRVNGNNYIEYATHASYLFFGCLALVIHGPARRLPWALAGAVGALFALMLIGARGPLVFSAVAILLAGGGLLLSPPRFASGARRLLILLAVLVAMAWAGFAALVAVKGPSGATEQLYTLQRFQLQLSNENTHSLDVRSEARDLAWRRWLEQPMLGWGLGEFRIQHSLEFPHNLSLEVLMETGLVGACLFFPALLIAVAACFRMARDRRTGWTDATIALLFLTEFLSHTTVQGYLLDDRIYFALLGMVIGWRVEAARGGPETAAAAMEAAKGAVPAPDRAAAGAVARW